jgi:hypothetical protein
MGDLRKKEEQNEEQEQGRGRADVLFNVQRGSAEGAAQRVLQPVRKQLNGACGATDQVAIPSGWRTK